MSDGDRRARERRMQSARLVYPERRTGFDPRRHFTVLGFLRDNQAVFLGVLIVLNALSLADWALTLLGLQLGAVEGNPVLAALMGHDMAVAGAFKLAVILAASVLMWRARAFRAVLATTLLGVAVYSAVIAYHVTGLATLGIGGR